MMQLIKYEGTMSFDGKKLTKIKEAAKNMYLVYQNPEIQFIANSVYKEILYKTKLIILLYQKLKKNNSNA